VAVDARAAGSEDPDDSTHLQRRRFGDYAILAELGRGGMSQVHLALKDGASDPCVVKELLREMRAHETARKRLEREAHLVLCLQHPNIARSLEVGVAEDTFYVATELVRGVDLSSVLASFRTKGKRLPIGAGARIAVSLLEALDYAHDAADENGRRLDLVHRDLTPRNLMISFSGALKLIDFGAARMRSDDDELTAPGSVIGTPRYLSPEQASGQRVDRRSDLYTAAIVIYEMLTGAAAVPEGTLMQVVYHVLTSVVLPPSTVNPELSSDVDAFFTRALAKRPEDRFQTAKEMRAALPRSMSSRLCSPEDLAALVRGLFPQRVQWVIDVGEQIDRDRAAGRLPPVEPAPARSSLETITGDLTNEATKIDPSAPAADFIDTLREAERPDGDDETSAERATDQDLPAVSSAEEHTPVASKKALDHAEKARGPSEPRAPTPGLPLAASPRADRLPGRREGLPAIQPPLIAPQEPAPRQKERAPRAPVEDRPEPAAIPAAKAPAEGPVSERAPRPTTPAPRGVAPIVIAVGIALLVGLVLGRFIWG
jgi:eukaryotic-like serine/threonine-protein kinase